jgi:hypothetical protein
MSTHPLVMAVALLASACGAASGPGTATGPGPTSGPTPAVGCPGGHVASVVLTSSAPPLPDRWAVDPCLGAVGITVTSSGAASATLTLTGGSWTVLSISPPPLYSPTMADDPANHRILLAGGTSAHWSGPGQTWAFTNGGWTQLNAALPHFDQGVMAADPAHNTVVLVQADPAYACAETWVLRTNGWTEQLAAASTTPCDSIFESPLGPVGISVYPTNGWRRWTGSSWDPIVGGPLAVGEATYDPMTQSLVALGSSQRSMPDAGVRVSATFVLTASGWSAGLPLPTALQGRVNSVLVAESSGAVALEDGTLSHGFIATVAPTYTDLWIWENSSWRQSHAM